MLVGTEAKVAFHHQQIRVNPSKRSQLEGVVQLDSEEVEEELGISKITLRTVGIKVCNLKGAGEE
jgi:hypothetical protein